MFRKYSFLAALLLLVTTQVFAATPRPINYQGYLAQPDGTPIDTTVAMAVELWTAATAGTLLYSEAHAVVAVSKGRFSIEIGTGTPVSGAFNADQFQQDTWLALTINGELLNPRSRLGAVAGSQHAEIAERLSTSCADGEWLGFRNGVIGCYECTEGVGSATDCYEGDSATLNIGICRAGRQSCFDGAYSGACIAQVLPSAESCNQLDDDCNGLVDDGTNLPGGAPEICNSIDDDCNGVVDDGPPESCNLIDDDCNGLVDDGPDPIGCITNQYIDGDGDGFGDSVNASAQCLCNTVPNTTSIGGDCNDADVVMNPGQTSYFTVASSLGTFDYNCNSTIEKNFGQPVASCTYNGSTCDYVAGFAGSIPNCGEAGVLSNGCSQSGSVCTVTTGFVGVTMGCR
jgi:hypothetical protein